MTTIEFWQRVADGIACKYCPAKPICFSDPGTQCAELLRLAHLKALAYEQTRDLYEEKAS